MRLRPLSVLFMLVFGLADGAARADDPFNPSSYIQDKATAAAKRAEKLDNQGIYRIDGRRYHQFVSADGAVYLPGTGSMPDMHEEFAVCESHLPLKSEVLPMRTGLKIEPEIKKIEAALVAMIRKCQEGLIKGPTVLVPQRDGAVVELKPKTPKDRREDRPADLSGGE